MTDTSTTVASAASVSPDYSVYLAREAERDRLDAELLPANKAALFEALAAAGIVTVVVSFDGYGDSGQIEAIEAHNEQGEATLPDAHIEIARAPWEGTEPERRTIPVSKAIEEMAYRFLEQTHGGWENNDGAYGEFVFNVAEGTIRLDYNERYTATEHYEHGF